MKKPLKIIALILCIFISVPFFSSCSKKADSTPVNAEDFRITAYVVGKYCSDADSFDTSHFNQLTDIILFGVAAFDENGEITLSDDFDICLKNIRSAMKDDGSQRLYLNVLGPGSTTDSEDWYDQMADQGEHHTKAFESGNLEENIKSVLESNGFDGVLFDYEYPIKKKYWKPYNEFIVSLDKVLGDDYKIGVALADWDIKQSDEAMAATDFVEVMSYDNWDDNGNHATMELAEKSIKKFVEAGYDASKLDMGVPFYARPTTQEAYWYDYASYYDKIDENGIYTDSDATGLTFSFNDYNLIKEKTQWAVDNGVGGMMVWHYTCDLPADNEKSLFNAIYGVKQAAIGAEK